MPECVHSASGSFAALPPELRLSYLQVSGQVPILSQIQQKDTVMFVKVLIKKLGICGCEIAESWPVLTVVGGGSILSSGFAVQGCVLNAFCSAEQNLAGLFFWSKAAWNVEIWVCVCVFFSVTGVLGTYVVPHLSNLLRDFENISIPVCCSLENVGPETSWDVVSSKRALRDVTIGSRCPGGQWKLGNISLFFFKLCFPVLRCGWLLVL